MHSSVLPLTDRSAFERQRRLPQQVRHLQPRALVVVDCVVVADSPSAAFLRDSRPLTAVITASTMHTSPPAGGRRLFKPTARPARPPTTTVVLQASKRTTHAHVEAFTYTLPTHKHRDTDTQTHTDIHARTHTHAHTHTHTTSTHHNDVPCSPHRQLGTAHETCVHRVATFMATCSNIVVVSVIIVLIEHCKDPSFTRWPHFSPS